MLKGRGPRPGSAFGGRHSRMVDLLRFALPATAALLIGLVVLWPHVTGGYGGLIVPVFGGPGIDSSEAMKMHQPRYVGHTRKAEPYEITADSAHLDPHDPDHIYLDQLIAELQPARGGATRLKAGVGVYHRDQEAIDLKDGLDLTTGDGYHFVTASAKIDLAAGQVVGGDPVTGNGPAGNLAADRFRIDQGGDVLRFDGRVKAVILPNRPAMVR
jgi:lipopolysaccharide export system protein LptC